MTKSKKYVLRLYTCHGVRTLTASKIKPLRKAAIALEARYAIYKHEPDGKLVLVEMGANE